MPDSGKDVKKVIIISVHMMGIWVSLRQTAFGFWDNGGTVTLGQKVER